MLYWIPLNSYELYVINTFLRILVVSEPSQDSDTLNLVEMQ